MSALRIEKGVGESGPDISALPTPQQAAKLIVGMFGEVEDGIVLPDLAQDLLYAQQIQVARDVNSRFSADFFEGKFVWAGKSLTSFTRAPLFNDSVPHIKPANFRCAQTVVSMTNVSYGYKEGPQMNLIFVSGPDDDNQVYYYQKNTGIDIYGTNDPFRILVNWKGDPMVDLSGWLDYKDRPRLSIWDKLDRNSYGLMAEFVTADTSFRQLLEKR